MAGALVEKEALTVTRVGEAGVEAGEAADPGRLAGRVRSRRFSIQASRFAAAIRGTASPLTPAEDAVQLMRMIDGLYASAR